ncbi:hypothetical protein G8764_04540 [Pseudomaricurvus alcaniphilus]|uniref:hypothetical protein n=1 Tax=Pseudomaricurvus alcaniphilus TaxID=1166482 RepID=UPI0014095469|nr:hypothetical protein [Pseudomaricurvus alcaniphilus]NHN36557.1 hypothetical protein [Pseudomaricurvus alcaniphilus]
MPLNKEEVELVRCPLCKGPVSLKNLRKHLRKVHDKADLLIESLDGVKSTPTVASKVPGKIRRTLYKCHQCRAKLPKANLLKHLNKIHDFHPTQTDRLHEFYFDAVIVESQPKPVSKAEKLRKLALKRYKYAFPGMLIECTFCLKRLSRETYLVHLSDKHLQVVSTVSNAQYKGIEQLYQDIVTEKYLTMTACRCCDKRFVPGKYLQHLEKAHGVTPSQYIRSPFNHNNRALKSNVENQFPKFECTGPADDIYDRKKVLQGGAYGLGKNRRH